MVRKKQHVEELMGGVVVETWATLHYTTMRQRKKERHGPVVLFYSITTIHMYSHIIVYKDHYANEPCLVLNPTKHYAYFFLYWSRQTPYIFNQTTN